MHFVQLNFKSSLLHYNHVGWGIWGIVVCYYGRNSSNPEWGLAAILLWQELSPISQFSPTRKTSENQTPKQPKNKPSKTKKKTTPHKQPKNHTTAECGGNNHTSRSVEKKIKKSGREATNQRRGSFPSIFFRGWFGFVWRCVVRMEEHTEVKVLCRPWNPYAICAIIFPAWMAWGISLCVYSPGWKWVQASSGRDVAFEKMFKWYLMLYSQVEV